MKEKKHSKFSSRDILKIITIFMTILVILSCSYIRSVEINLEKQYIQRTDEKSLTTSKMQEDINETLKEAMQTIKTQVIDLNAKLGTSDSYKYQYEFYVNYPEIALNYIPKWTRKSYNHDLNHCMLYGVTATSDKMGDIRLEEIEERTQPIIEKAKTLKSDYAKVKYVVGWIIENSKYSDSPWDPWDANMYGCIVNGSANCVGFSETFNYFMNKLDIPCEIVVSIKEHHAWNKVMIDGVIYEVDVTKYNTGIERTFPMNMF